MENTQEKFEATNTINIVGTLVKADVKTGNMKSSGEGYVSVKATVESMIDGVKNTYDLDFFSQQLTKADDKGNRAESKLYASYVNMTSLIGKKVRVSGNITEDRFVNKTTNTITSAQKLNGRFISGVADAAADEGTFTIGGFIISALRENTNKDGDIYRYTVEVGQEGYNGLNKFALHVDPQDTDIVSGLEALGTGATFRLNGRLSFVTTTETVEQAAAFGKPIVKTYTNTRRNYFIESGSNENIIEYTDEAITKLVGDYKAKGVELLNAAKTTATTTATTATAAKPISTRQASLL